jgi:hypothetical protein
MLTFKKADVSSRGLPSVGVHMAKLLKATQQNSQKNNPMLKLQYGLIPGREIVFDYLVFLPEQGGKIGDFCNSAQLVMPEDDSISFGMPVEHLIDRFVYIRIEIEEDNQGRGPRAIVAQYLTREGALAKAPNGTKFPTVTQTPFVLPVIQPPDAGNSGDEPDDIPF